MKLYKSFSLLCLTAFACISCNPRPPKPTVPNPQSTNPSTNPPQEARIAIAEDGSTCDPRKARSLGEVNLTRFLFEGLMRKNAKNELEPALAESYTLSQDGKTYTFTLRDSNWSNGEKILASDVEYSLKSSLDPNFRGPNANQLFVIENAKASYDKNVSPDAIGVKALDAKTVEIRLENPTSYFLELLSFHPFFPVSQKWVQAHPEWKEGNEIQAVGSGPFTLLSWNPHSEIVLKKNAEYFDAKHVKLEKVKLTCLDDNTALNMFEIGDLEWTGSPTCVVPPDAINSLKKEKKLHIVPAAGTQILRVNCQSQNFSNPKLRKAFAYAIDRKGISEHVMQGGHFPATSFVPPCMGLSKTQFFDQRNEDLARALFYEVMHDSAEENRTPITLSYVITERNQKIAQALQQNWKNAFQIDVLLDPCESKTFFEKLGKKDFQLALGNWFADFQDPISFLSLFQYKNNGSNHTQWENIHFQKLLQEAALEQNQEKRFALFDAAQSLLMEEMPAIPIFHFTFNFLKKPGLQDATLSPLGYIELKEAYMGS